MTSWPASASSCLIEFIVWLGVVFFRIPQAQVRMGDWQSIGAGFISLVVCHYLIMGLEVLRDEAGLGS